MGICRLVTSQQDTKGLGPGSALCELQTWGALKVYGQANREDSGIGPKLSVHRGETEAQIGGGASCARPQASCIPQRSAVARSPRTLTEESSVRSVPQALSDPPVHLEPRRCQPGAPESLGAFDFPVSSQTHRLASFTGGHCLALSATVSMTDSETGPSGPRPGQAQGEEALA